MILLLECPGCLCISKRRESCSGRRLGSATPSTAPALLSQLWLDTLLGPAKRELHPPQSGETNLLYRFNPPVGKSQIATALS